MATTINADDGAVSGSAGLKSTADATGVLALQANGTTALSINSSGSFSIPIAGSRITADFNGTITNRLQFQTSTANSSTFVGSIPSGTGVASGFTARNNSDPTNSSSAIIQVNATEASVISSINGTGTYLPLTFYTSGSEKMRIDTSGTVTLASGSGLSISATAVTSPASTDGNVFSGTYTPTLTNTTNISASTAQTLQYMRVGNVVTVSGSVLIDPTATGLITLGLSLPIASNFSAVNQCGGTLGTVGGERGVIYADATNDRATFQATIVSDVSNTTYRFSFTYLVI